MILIPRFSGLDLGLPKETQGVTGRSLFAIRISTGKKSMKSSSNLENDSREKMVNFGWVARNLSTNAPEVWAKF